MLQRDKICQMLTHIQVGVEAGTAGRIEADRIVDRVGHTLEEVPAGHHSRLGIPVVYDVSPSRL